MIELNPTQAQAKLFADTARARRRVRNYLVRFGRIRFQTALWHACKTYAATHNLDPVEVRKQWADKKEGRAKLKANGFSYQVNHVNYYTLTTPWTKNRKRRWMLSTVAKARNQACSDYKAATDNFFKSIAGKRKGKPAGPPQFESRFGKNRFSVQVQGTTRIVRKNEAIRKGGKATFPHDGLNIEKIGLVRWKEDPSKRFHGGRISRLTVWRDVDRWYATLLITDMPDPVKPHGRIDGSVGIDLNTGTNGIVLSTGKKFPVPPKLEELDQEIRRHQRLNRNKQGRRKGTKPSTSWLKQNHRLKTLYRKQRRIRDNWLHEATTWIASHYRVAVIEDLNVRGMTRSAKGTCDAPGKNVKAKAGLNRRILQAAFSTFRTFLDYKMAQTGGELVIVDRFFASSQICNHCGWRPEKNLDMNVRVYKCGDCGHTENRDKNAARNLRKAYEETMAEVIKGKGGGHPRWTGRPLVEGHLTEIKSPGGSRNRRRSPSNARAASVSPGGTVSP